MVGRIDLYDVQHLVVVVFVLFYCCKPQQQDCADTLLKVLPDENNHYLDLEIGSISGDGAILKSIENAQVEYLKKSNSLILDSIMYSLLHYGTDCFCTNYLKPIITNWERIDGNDKSTPFFFNGRLLADSLVNRCDQVGVHITNPLKDQSYIDALATLSRKDQFHRKKRFRKIGSRTDQATLDQENRKALDSLYSMYGFPSFYKVGYKGHDAAWRILHHSEYCNWNTEWFKRFINDYYNNPFEYYSLLQTYKRLYDPDVGFCRHHKHEIDNYLSQRGDLKFDNLK